MRFRVVFVTWLDPLPVKSQTCLCHLPRKIAVEDFSRLCLGASPGLRCDALICLGLKSCYAGVYWPLPRSLRSPHANSVWAFLYSKVMSDFHNPSLFGENLVNVCKTNYCILKLFYSMKQLTTVVNYVNYCILSFCLSFPCSNIHVVRMLDVSNIASNIYSHFLLFSFFAIRLSNNQSLFWMCAFAITPITHSAARRGGGDWPAGVTFELWTSVGELWGNPVCFWWPGCWIRHEMGLVHIAEEGPLRLIRSKEFP